MVRAPTDAILAGFSEGVFTVAVHRDVLDGVYELRLPRRQLCARQRVPRDRHRAYCSASTGPTTSCLGALTLRASSVVDHPCPAGRREAVHRQHGGHPNRHPNRRRFRSSDVHRARRAGATIRARGGFSGGRARCVLTVPRSAAGKLPSRNADRSRRRRLRAEVVQLPRARPGIANTDQSPRRTGARPVFTTTCYRRMRRAVSGGQPRRVSADAS